MAAKRSFRCGQLGVSSAEWMFRPPECSASDIAKTPYLSLKFVIVCFCALTTDLSHSAQYLSTCFIEPLARNALSLEARCNVHRAYELPVLTEFAHAGQLAVIMPVRSVFVSGTHDMGLESCAGLPRAGHARRWIAIREYRQSRLEY
jgi:hypothetical protein